MTRLGDAEVRQLRTELLEAHRELSRVRAQHEQLVAINRDMSSQLMASSQLNGELLRANVAFRRLLESRDSAEALRAIEEILINIIGTEDFVVLLATETPRMRIVAGMGYALELAGQSTPTVEELELASHRVIPMHVDDHLVGAIVIGALLPHRDALGHADEEVLELISAFAATAVMAADYRQGWVAQQVGAA